MDGYKVESFADAPMRTRAWFERLEDAQAYGAQFGDSVWITPEADAESRLADMRAEHRAEVNELEEEIEQAERNAEEEANDATAELDDEIQALKDRIRALTPAAAVNA